MADLEFAQNLPEDKSTIQLTGEAQKKFERITRNLQEVTSADVIKKVLQEGRTVKAYWGTAPTGRPHIAYCVALLKIADFLNAGVNVKVLLADIHAFLDAAKSSLETVAHRVTYYSYLLKSVFTSLGVPTDKLEFVTGSSYQLSKEYTLDVYRLHSMATNKAAEHAGADVVKGSESPLMSSLLYPGLQALDEQYLDVDFQFGGVDQRKIFMYAAHFLPKLGYSKRTHLMNAMVPGLSGGKMSSSDPSSKIDFLDSPAEIKSKLKGAFCKPGVVAENGVLAFLKTVLIPVQEMRNEQAASRGEANGPRGPGTFVSVDAPESTIFSIARPDKFGGPIHYASYAAVEQAYAKEGLHPDDLKSGVAAALVELLSPISKMFNENEEWQAAERLAYPETSVSAKALAAAQPKKAPVKAAKKEYRAAPPTEEERAALREKKEAEKKAKAEAKAAQEGGITPQELTAKSAQAAQVEPVGSAAGSSTKTVTHTDMPKLKLLAKGKVRDIYALPDAADADKLLFVATDRISAFDVIMDNGIPQKGVTLTTLSAYWFHKLAHIMPNHVLTPSLEGDSPACLTSSCWEQFPRSLDEYRDQLEGRSMIVQKCEVLKVEAIVRGYITGSAWAEYKKTQTVHGIKMPAGLVESQKLPKAIFTPSTKADQGEHDENIHPDKVKDIVGAERAAEIEEKALRLYNEAADFARERGVILADTKFEFGLLPSKTGGKPTMILIDEVLTPDSSRYWAADTYEEGKPQDSFDKQYVRDWLIKEGLRNKEGVALPEDVVQGTQLKYEEAKERIMGEGKFAKHGKGPADDSVMLQTDAAADAIASS